MLKRRRVGNVRRPPWQPVASEGVEVSPSSKLTSHLGHAAPGGLGGLWLGQNSTAKGHEVSLTLVSPSPRSSAASAILHQPHTSSIIAIIIINCLGPVLRGLFSQCCTNRFTDNACNMENMTRLQDSSFRHVFRSYHCLCTFHSLFRSI